MAVAIDSLLLAEFAVCKQTVRFEACHFELEVVAILDSIARLLWFLKTIESTILSIITFGITDGGVLTIIAVSLLSLLLFVRPLRQFPSFSTHYLLDDSVLAVLVEPEPVLHLLHHFFPQLTHRLLVVSPQLAVHAQVSGGQRGSGCRIRAQHG